MRQGNYHQSRIFRTGALLMEIAFVVVIVGVTCTAIMEFLIRASKSNVQLTEFTIGMNYAQAGHEWVRTRPYADLKAWTTTPPTLTQLMDARGEQLAPSSANGSQWQQAVSARLVQNANLKTNSTDTTNDKIIEVTVTVRSRHKSTEPYHNVFSVARLYAPPPGS